MHFAAAYHDLEQQDKSDAYLQELIEKYALDASYNIAGAYAWRGDIDLAFNFLEDALQNNDSGLSSVRTNYWLNNLHDDPRWQPYLAKLGRSDAQLELIEFNVSPPE